MILKYSLIKRSVSFFGDGAANEGAVHEAMNFAGLLKLQEKDVRVQYYEGSGTYGHSCYDDVAQAAATLEALNAENLKNATGALELDKTLAETTARLTKVSAKLDVLRVKVEAVRQSKWYKLGRHLGLGPKVD